MFTQLARAEWETLGMNVQVVQMAGERYAISRAGKKETQTPYKRM